MQSAGPSEEQAAMQVDDGFSEGIAEEMKELEAQISQLSQVSEARMHQVFAR